MGLRPTAAPILALSLQGEPQLKQEEGTTVGCLDFSAYEHLCSAGISYEGI